MAILGNVDCFHLSRSLMYSEANRRETFTSWPHVGYRWAQPDPMAQAGFYHQVRDLVVLCICSPIGRAGEKRW